MPVTTERPTGLRGLAVALRVGLTIAPLAGFLFILMVLVGAPANEGTGSGGDPRFRASAYALSDIPPKYLDLYKDAGEQYGLDWAVLAAIGSIETDHGRSPLPGVKSGVNGHGCCGGPMQFWIAPPHPNTWDAYGVDGNDDGQKNPHDPADAIPAAGNYLRASGAPGDYRKAIWAYNHATWYVDDVLALADRYRGQLVAPSAVELAPGDRARLKPDGTAQAPEDAPDAVKRMIAAGNKIGNRPYLYGGGHPNFTTAWGLDCSSSTSLILNAGGVFGTSSIVSGMYETWGEPGPGKWVTIYANAEHVFTEIAGLRNDTGRYDSGPNAGESGPRWRLGPRYKTGFVVRHPPGL